jgi:hypothetical protein
MTETELLAWVYHRTRNGLFSFKRSERDKALSDVNFATQQYVGAWTPIERDPNKIWMGEQP